LVKERFDVIVVGAGASGLAAAYTLAKAGVKVAILERGEYPGSKNVMGGLLYREPTEKIIPGFLKEAPLERKIVEKGLWLLSEDSGIKINYSSRKFGAEPNCFTVLRAKFDKWFAGKVVQAGGLLLTKTVVENVIFQGNKVVGVETDRPNGELYADVVIAADGVRSLIAEKAGLNVKVNANTVAYAAKEIIALQKDEIERRFNLNSGEGAAYQIIGSPLLNMNGQAFLYTNMESLSIGVGAPVSGFVSEKTNPHELIEKFKEHPLIKPLLEGGAVREYLGHQIPEGGVNAMPKLYSDGILVVGDAAMLVNPVFQEGANLAMTSGYLAAKTVIEAKRKGDFSSKTLSLYKKMLEDSFVLKDLRNLKRFPSYLKERPGIFKVYAEILNEAIYELLKVDGIPKKDKMKKMIRIARKRRGAFKILKDLLFGLRALGVP
jgi:electron transfer flavoprotein-quinone oxidoreductase